ADYEWAIRKIKNLATVNRYGCTRSILTVMAEPRQGFWILCVKSGLQPMNNKKESHMKIKVPVGHLGRILVLLTQLFSAGCFLSDIPRCVAAVVQSLEEQEKEIDKKQMRQIYDAIQAYRKKHGDLPTWLSD